jgi:hypothetical protein
MLPHQGVWVLFGSGDGRLRFGRVRSLEEVIKRALDVFYRSIFGWRIERVPLYPGKVRCVPVFRCTLIWKSSVDLTESSSRASGTSAQRAITILEHFFLPFR